MVFSKFVNWLMGGRSTRDWIIRLRLIERRIERQRMKLKKDENKMMKEVRRAVEQGDMEAAKVFAQDVVRSRRFALGCARLNSRLKGIIAKMEHTDAVQSIVKDMKGLAISLRQLNRSLRVPQLGRYVEQLEEGLTGIEVSTETIDEELEGALSSDIDEEEVTRILGEAGAVVSVTTEHGLPTPSAKEKEIKEELERLREEES
ncbi:MAG: Snf7 family protein [Candidatus Wukongarchaeota archaeon]|nr:Snf7 family protein [Candidatus Wukongarchaeota archaeon]